MRKLICLGLVLFTLGMLTACGGSGDNLSVAYVKQSAIYGTTFGSEALGTSNLVLINFETGELITTLGDIGYYVSSLTYDDTTDKIYATTIADDPVFPNGLIEINKSTGAGTPIGDSYEFPLDCPAINSAGELFALRISGGEVSDVLVSIDKATGTVTEIGTINLITGNPGMAFDNCDVLWLINAYVDGDLKESGVYTINTTTAERTYISYIEDDNIIAAHGDFIPDSAGAEQEYAGLDATGAGLKNARILNLSSFPATIVETVPAAVENLNAITFGYRFVPVAF